MLSLFLCEMWALNSAVVCVCTICWMHEPHLLFTATRLYVACKAADREYSGSVDRAECDVDCKLLLLITSKWLWPEIIVRLFGLCLDFIISIFVGDCVCVCAVTLLTRCITTGDRPPSQLSSTSIAKYICAASSPRSFAWLWQATLMCRWLFGW